MKVHEILRALRLNHRDRLSIEELADKLGLAYSTYQSYETDESKIKVETLEQIAAFYNLTLLELLSYNEGPPSVVMEPYLPYAKKSNKLLKVIIELDGTENVLKYWFNRLESINAAL